MSLFKSEVWSKEDIDRFIENFALKTESKSLMLFDNSPLCDYCFSTVVCSFLAVSVSWLSLYFSYRYSLTLTPFRWLFLSLDSFPLRLLYHVCFSLIVLIWYCLLLSDSLVSLYYHYLAVLSSKLLISTHPPIPSSYLITPSTSGLDLFSMVPSTVHLSLVSKVDQINQQCPTVMTMETGWMIVRVSPSSHHSNLSLFHWLGTLKD